MDAKQRHDDEAGRIRRWSPGPSQQAHDNGSNANANASIGGSFWISLFAMIGVVAVAILAGYSLGATNRDRQATLQELDDQSSRIYVLEYDVNHICEALKLREIIEECH